MTTRVAAGGGNAPKRTMVQPALPTEASGQDAARGPLGSNAIHPSPLKESSVASALGQLNVQDDSEDEGNVLEMNNLSGHLRRVAQTAIAYEDPIIAHGSNRVTLLPRAASFSTLPRATEIEHNEVPHWDSAASDFGRSGQVEDPFVTPPPRSKTAMSTSVAPTPKAPSKAVKFKTISMDGISPRADRLNDPVTPANAQGLFPPSACVFVANLSNQRCDEQLEHSVYNAFDIYGKCYVKIRRDKNRMPFGFIQYEKEEDAAEALKESKNLFIDGRQVRTEGAKVHRAVYLTKTTGGSISDKEAREVLGRFGAIEETCPTNVVDQEMSGLPEGTWVKFHFFQDCKDATVAMKNNDHYRLIIHNVEDPRSRAALEDTPTPDPCKGKAQQPFPDMKSLFAGNLPNDATEDTIRQLLSPFGHISSVSVIHKPLPPSRVNSYAFVTFDNAREAQHALKKRDELKINGRAIRLEVKDNRTKASSRVPKSPTKLTNRLIRSKLYSDALQMGLPAEEAMQILLPTPHGGSTSYGSLTPVASSPQYPTPPYSTQLSGPRYSNDISPTPGYYYPSSQPMVYAGPTNVAYPGTSNLSYGASQQVAYPHAHPTPYGGPSPIPYEHQHQAVRMSTIYEKAEGPFSRGPPN